MTMIGYRRKGRRGTKSPPSCQSSASIDQVKKRNLVAEIVAAADDSALLAELHERDLDVEALVKDHDAAELVRLVRRVATGTRHDRRRPRPASFWTFSHMPAAH